MSIQLPPLTDARIRARAAEVRAEIDAQSALLGIVIGSNSYSGVCIVQLASRVARMELLVEGMTEAMASMASR